MTFLFPVDVADLLASMEDLEEVQTALSREKVIRNVMASSGEDRQTIIDFMDAHASMDQEAVLDLTDGEPTTLADALGRYVDSLDRMTGAGEDIPADVIAELQSLLAYPWLGQITITAEMVDAFATGWNAQHGTENVMNCSEHNMGDCPYHNTPGARRRAGLKAALTSAGFQVVDTLKS
jgi:hypothetical protein